MSDEFDPYYTWLGIPPDEQPPDCYRLLGVRRFEASPEVISNACDQRMSHVRTFQTGKRGVYSQRLLNELSAARGQLLNPERKATYDAQLRSTMPPPRATAEPPLLNSSAPVAVLGHAGIADPAAATRPLVVNRTTPRRRPSAVVPMLAAVAGVAGLAIIGLIIAVLIRGDATPSEAVATVHTGSPESGAPPNPPETSQATRAQPRSQANPPRANTPPDSGAKPHPTTPTGGADPTQDDPASEPTSGDTSEPTSGDASGPTPDESPESGSSDPPGSNSSSLLDMQSVPSGRELEAADAKVRDDFADRFGSLKSASDRMSLANRLLEAARGPQLAAAERYALFRHAQKQFVEAHAVARAFSVASEVCDRYATDPWDRRLELFQEFGKQLKEPKEFAELAQLARELAIEAAEQFQMDASLETIKVAVANAKKARDKELERSVALRLKELQILRDRWPEAKAARERLLEDDADANAHLVWGRFLCLFSKHVAESVPHFAKCDDPKLMAAANLDQEQPSGSDEQFAVGEAWWEASRAASATDRRGLMDRSRMWYLRAQPSLSGAQNDKAEKRIAEVDKLIERAKITSPGRAPQAGAKVGLVGRIFVDGRDSRILVYYEPGSFIRREEIIARLKQIGYKSGQIQLKLQGILSGPATGRVRVSLQNVEFRVGPTVVGADPSRRERLLRVAPGENLFTVIWNDAGYDGFVDILDEGRARIPAFHSPQMLAEAKKERPRGELRLMGQ